MEKTAEYTCTGGCGRVLRGYVGRSVCPTCWRKRSETATVAAAPAHTITISKATEPSGVEGRRVVCACGFRSHPVSRVRGVAQSLGRKHIAHPDMGALALVSL